MHPFMMGWGAACLSRWLVEGYSKASGDNVKLIIEAASLLAMSELNAEDWEISNLGEEELPPSKALFSFNFLMADLPATG